MTLGVSFLRENDLVYAGYLDDVIQVKVVLTVVVNAGNSSIGGVSGIKGKFVEFTI